MRYFIGVDVGGTTSTIAVGSPDRDVLYVSDQFETRSAAGPIATVQDIVGQITQFLDQRGHSTQDIASVVLATPGPATRDGVLLKTPNLDAKLWNRCPIRKMLETALAEQDPGITVHYIGDGQAAAYGEYAIRKRLLNWPEIWTHPLEGRFAPVWLARWITKVPASGRYASTWHKSNRLAAQA